MRKIASIFTAVTILMSLAACGSGSSTTQNEPSAAPTVDATVSPAPVSEQTETDAASESSKAAMSANILVAYFSRVGNMNVEDGVDLVTSASVNLNGDSINGNAELLARMAQEVTGGDLFFIETADKYPAQYRATTDQASVEQSQNARPALASHVENMDAYDTIILIYPNWWGTLPQALFTFLEEYDFSGKTILPLCTHEGSRMGRSESDIAALCPNATLLGGLAVRGSSVPSAQSDVETWIAASGILS